MPRPHRNPPHAAKLLIQWMSLYEEDFSWEGDLEEEYRDRAQAGGCGRARLWYLFQVIKSLPPYAKYIVFWSIIMLKNYLITALRNIKRQKVYSFLNLTGLTIGIACFMLISLYVRDELSYDRYHKDADRIYRISAEHPFVYHGKNQSAITPAPLAPALKDELPEVAASVRITDASDVLLSVGEKSFLEEAVLFAGQGLFDVFSFSFLQGDPGQALDHPNSIILSQTMAVKYFGRVNPIGKIIQYSGRHDLTVTGIIKDMPSNSHFRTDFILPFKFYGIINNDDLKSWQSSGYYTYMRLAEDADPASMENKLEGFLARSAPPGQSLEGFRYFLQPLTRIHLYSDLIGEIGPNGSIKNVYIFGVIAFLILLIACINYMNLVTARAAQRSREVGIRKVVGAKRGQITRQFFVETILMAFLALLIATLLVYAFLPSFNSFVGKTMTFDPIRHPELLAWMSGLIFGIAVLAGIYPAWIISSLSPVSGIKGLLKRRTRGLSLRNFLVVLQFSISIILIICTMAVRGQLSFIRKTDVGYQRDQIVTLRIRDPEIRRNLRNIKADLLKNTRISAVATSSNLPHRITNLHRVRLPGAVDEDYLAIYQTNVDYDFLDLFEIELAEGRSFSREIPSDGRDAVILNEAAVKALGFSDPLDKEIIFPLHGGTEQRVRIIGVMKNFNMLSLHQKIEPLHLSLDASESQRYLSVKINSDDPEETLAYISDTMALISSVFPFEYQFFDDVFLEVYRNDQRMAEMFNIFALLAIFIACLGLFGLASFATEQRVKEIGIRKVLGASVSSISARLSLEFTRSVLASNLIAWPVAYLIMAKWLQNFAYKTSLGIGIFILSALFALGLALLTVLYQSIKAASANPVRALKYE